MTRAQAPALPAEVREALTLLAEWLRLEQALTAEVYQSGAWCNLDAELDDLYPRLMALDPARLRALAGAEGGEDG